MDPLIVISILVVFILSVVVIKWMMDRNWNNRLEVERAEIVGRNAYVKGQFHRDCPYFYPYKSIHRHNMYHAWCRGYHNAESTETGSKEK